MRDLGDALARGERPDSLTDGENAMLDYAIKLTRDPGGMTSADTDALRAAGFRDTAILDICQVTSYYNYVNRLADGLGVELEDYWEGMDHTLTREEFVALRPAGGVAPSRGAAAAHGGPAEHEEPATPGGPATQEDSATHGDSAG